MGLIFKLIILFLYGTSSPKIIINGYKYFFFLYNISNRFIVLGVIWFLVTLVSTITLNYLSRYLIFRLKCLLIVPLRV